MPSCSQRATGAGSPAPRPSRSPGEVIRSPVRSRGPPARRSPDSWPASTTSSRSTIPRAARRPRARADVPTRPSITSPRCRPRTTTERCARPRILRAREPCGSFVSPSTGPGTSWRRWTGGESSSGKAPYLCRGSCAGRFYRRRRSASGFLRASDPSRPRSRPRAVCCRPSSNRRRIPRLTCSPCSVPPTRRTPFCASRGGTAAVRPARTTGRPAPTSRTVRKAAA